MKLKFVTKMDMREMDKTKEVFIFGGGEYARQVASYLRNNGVNVTGYCLDDEYFNKSITLDVIARSALANRPEGDYILFYAVGNVNRLRQMECEDWHKEAFIIWNPFTSLDDTLPIEKLADTFEATLDLWADDLSRRTQRGFVKALQSGTGYDDLKNLCPDIYFNNLTIGLKLLEGGFVDCGAYDGDSARKYLDFVGDRKQMIWAFEPDADNAGKLRQYFQGRPNTHCIEKGVWDTETTLHLSTGNKQASCIVQNGGTDVDVMTIDEAVGDDRVACIKMDVEGSELKALYGAAKVIRRDYPMLLISAYHKRDDLITLPSYIHALDAQGRYKLYLRHHACCRTELVLYAIPKV